MSGEINRQAESKIDPIIIEDARAVIQELGFAQYADSVVTHNGQTLTLAEGLASHWDQALALDGEQLYGMVSQYAAIAAAQQQS